MQKPFPREAELAEKTARLSELNAMLNMDERSPTDTLGVDEETDQSIQESGKKERAGYVADHAAWAVTFAERSEDLKASKEMKEGMGHSRERGKESLLGRLQEKKAAVEAGTIAYPAVRLRPEPVL